MIELNCVYTDLSGIHLIEASAGTGKTHAISDLYLRLLVEEDLLPEQILTVTYTEAATSELRGRIRGRIREAIEVLDGTPTPYVFLRALADNENGRGPGPAAMREKLERALHAFDTASIFTIHGFCLRALRDNAFESGSLYDTELLTDPEEFLREIVDDFWRSRFFADASPLLPLVLLRKDSPDHWMGFVKDMVSNPKLTIVPAFSPGQAQAVEALCRGAFEEVRRLWRGQSEAIREILENDKGLSRSEKAYRQDLLGGLFESMDRYTEGDNPYNVFADFYKFTASGIAAGTKPKGVAPTHPFFDACAPLQKSIDDRRLVLLAELIDFCKRELPERKRRANVRFFDDLLNDLSKALSGASGGALAASLRHKYRAALIDEFQDTDPVQYDIFKCIYAGTDAPLFLIGDPKQAIYSFRGADIFAYLKAASDVDQDKRFTLTRNWRSSPALLSAFNAIFAHSDRPFLFDEIRYVPLSPGNGDGKKEPALPSDEAAPFRIWLVPQEDDGKPMGVTRANEILCDAIAGEISRLLGRGAKNDIRADGRPLLPRDIAVIVRSHHQAGFVQSALRKAAIPSVVRTDKSVFDTDEARAICTLLRALAEPARESGIRAALLTDLLGKTGDDLAAFDADEGAWEKWVAAFREYHEVWLKRGFMVMAQLLMAKEGVRGRLLRYEDGERRLTNVLHCFELLHQKEHEHKQGPEALVAWFDERVSVREQNEEYQIRLETDEEAVRIVTIHGSKGLGYPVVFCPFMWGGVKKNTQVVTFHDQFTMVKDYGSSDYEQNLKLARKEELAENLRLFYVGLTRAKILCYLCAGKIGTAKSGSLPATSALDYLFYTSPETQKSGDPVDAVAKEAARHSAAEIENRYAALAKKHPQALTVLPLPQKSAVRYAPASVEDESLSARVFSGTVASDWRITSFTSLTSHEPVGLEWPDYDAINIALRERETEMQNDSVAATIFSFPRGAQAGNFFHKLFEKINFADVSRADMEALVDRELAKHHYDSKWRSAVCGMLQNVLTTRLSSPDGSFALSDLLPGAWVSEMEYYFPLRFVTSGEVAACLAKWGAARDGADLAKLRAGLKFKPVCGMLKGFMDMVFERGGRYYLLDWKSNHLGNRVDDYSRESMKEEMERNFYPLQYLLYTVALNRYLSLKLSDYDYKARFGGVIYVFLRGVSEAHGEAFGFYRDIPPVGLIDELTRILAAEGG